MKKTAVLLLVLLMIVPFFTGAEGTDGMQEPARYTYGDYEYIVLEDGTAEIVRCSNAEGELAIPDTLDGRTVSSIGDSAFMYRGSLTRITIPDSVTSIGTDAFAECESLTITVSRDSYALAYCKENRLKYKYPDALDWLND